MSFGNLEYPSKSELIAMVEKLQRSDIRFQSLIEHTSDALFCYEYNPPISITLPIKIQIKMLYNGVLVECNDNAAKSYGYSQTSEVLGKSLTELFRALPGSLDDFFRSFIENEYRTSNAEAQETLEDGSKRYFLNNGHAVITNGHIERIWGTYQEITDIKKAEELLRYQAKLLENVSDAVISTDLDFRIRTWNKAAEYIYGWEEEEVVGKSLRETTNVEYPYEKEEDVINRVLSEGLWKGEITQLQKDGSPLNIHTYISLVKDDVGTPIAILAVNRDISIRKRIEEALIESEERLELALKGGDLGIWDHNLETGIVIRNERTAKIQGLTIEEIEENVGWWESRIHPEDKLEVKEKLNQCIRGLTPLYEADYRLLHRSGNWRWVSSRGKVVEYDENNKAIRIAGILRDITEQKQAELLKKELEQRRENFIWMTSHELRTPLTVISGYFEIVEKKFSNMDEEKRAMISSIIRKNLNRFEYLVDRVSSIIQIEKDLFEIEFAELDICKFLKNVIEPYKQILGKQITYHGYQKDTLLITNGDKDRLQQVLENIIGNAIKQTHPKRRAILVKLKVFNNDIQILISDNGAGIASANLEKIFEQFISVNTDYSVTGTGLGLFISRRILEAHKGSIVARSAGIGMGATFIITLPRI